MAHDPNLYAKQDLDGVITGQIWGVTDSTLASGIYKIIVSAHKLEIIYVLI